MNELDLATSSTGWRYWSLNFENQASLGVRISVSRSLEGGPSAG